MLGKNFSRQHSEIFLFLENRTWHFMTIVSSGTPVPRTRRAIVVTPVISICMIPIPVTIPMTLLRGWFGGAKVSCSLRHQGVQLILAYNWARPAILVAGKGKGGMFLFLLFLHFHSCSSFFPVPLFHFWFSSTISSISFLPFSGRWHKTFGPQGLTSFNPNTTNQHSALKFLARLNNI